MTTVRASHLPRPISPAFSRFQYYVPHFALLFATVLVLAFLTACGKNEVDQALDSDANGYLCLGCEARFYTARQVFATRCPACQKNNIEQVLGFICETDKHMTIDARGRGACACAKCGKLTTAIGIPREADLKSWGAEKKSAAEVGG